MTDGSYALAHRRSIQDPEGFWGEAALGIDWITKPRQVLDDSRPPFYRWFEGGQLNTCYNALDRHVIGGRGDQPALYYDSPVTGSARTLTYAELWRGSDKLACQLARLLVWRHELPRHHERSEAQPHPCRCPHRRRLSL